MISISLRSKKYIHLFSTTTRHRSRIQHIKTHGFQTSKVPG
jgi:hypothetical protein